MLQPWKREELASSPSMLQHFIDVVSYGTEVNMVLWPEWMHFITGSNTLHLYVCVRGCVCAGECERALESVNMIECVHVWSCERLTLSQLLKERECFTPCSCLYIMHRLAFQRVTGPPLSPPWDTPDVRSNIWQIHTLSDLIINDQCGKGTQHARGKHLCSNSMVDLVGSNWLKCTPNYIPVFSHQPTLLSPSSVTLNILLSLI